jgi:hypothetical protein
MNNGGGGHRYQTDIVDAANRAENEASGAKDKVPSHAGAWRNLPPFIEVADVSVSLAISSQRKFFVENDKRAEGVEQVLLFSGVKSTQSVPSVQPTQQPVAGSIK